MTRKRTIKTHSERVNLGWYDWRGHMDKFSKRLWRKRDRAAAKREARKERQQ